MVKINPNYFYIIVQYSSVKNNQGWSAATLHPLIKQTPTGDPYDRGLSVQLKKAFGKKNR